MKNEPAKQDGSALPDQLKMSSPLASQALFWRARYRSGPDFLHYMPLVFWLTEVAAPQTLVEVGLTSGQGYFAFCQAMERLNIGGRCRGFSEDVPDQAIVDYNRENYEDFSSIKSGTATTALKGFSDGTVDLLVVNAGLPDEIITTLSDIWDKKLSEKSIILFKRRHDRMDEQVTQNLIAELASKRPTITFEHGSSVTIVLYGPHQDARLRHLAEIEFGSREHIIVNAVFNRLGSGHYHEWRSQKFEKEADAEAAKVRQTLSELKITTDALEAAEKKLEALESAYEDRNVKITEMQVALFDLQKEASREMSGMRDQIASLQAELKEEQAARAEETRRADLATEEIKTVQSQAKSAASDFNMRLEEITRRLHDTQKEKDDAESMLQKQNLAHEDEIGALTKKLAEIDKEHRELQSSHDALKAQFNTLERDLVSERDQAQQEASERQSEIETLTACLKSAETARDDLIAERDQARQEAETARNIHTQEVFTLTKQLNAYDQSIQKMTAEHVQIRKDFEKATRAAEAALKERDQAQQEARERQSEIDTLTACLKSAKTARDDLVAELKREIDDAARIKETHTNEVTSLTKMLIEAENEVQLKRSLEEKLSEATAQSEFAARYYRVQLQLRELRIEQMLSRSKLSISGRLAQKKSLEEKARLLDGSPRFNREWYLTANPDVKATGIDPALHFVSFGFYEGRAPSQDFDYIAYLASKPDILKKEVGSILDEIFSSE